MSDAATTPAQGSFDALLAEITEPLAKAIPTDGDTAADDAAIAAAAADGADGAEDGKDKEDGKDAPVAKSFKIVLESGEEIEAVDGAELVKALVDRVEKNEGAVLGALRSAVEVIGKQGEMIKSLQSDFARLGDSGKGRKAVLTIAEKPAPKAEEIAKAAGSEQMGADEFMAKALLAQGAGRLTGIQVAVAESHLNSGKAPPADIVRAVLGDGK